MKKLSGILLSALMLFGTTTSEGISIDYEINPIGDKVVQQELDKIPNDVKQLLVDNDVEIQIQEGLAENYEQGVITFGVYNFDTNTIVMDDSKESIEYALIHEIGHALDDILDISNTYDMQYSYNSNEIIYSNSHFNKDIEEYVAQGIQEYYNGNLNNKTCLHDTIEYMLNEI